MPSLAHTKHEQFAQSVAKGISATGTCVNTWVVRPNTPCFEPLPEQFRARQFPWTCCRSGGTLQTLAGQKFAVTRIVRHRFYIRTAYHGSTLSHFGASPQLHAPRSLCSADPSTSIPNARSRSNTLAALIRKALHAQVGFGSEHSIDSTGTYWFYRHASNRFVQKCPLCTTDLSHVTDLPKELPRRRSGRAPILPTVIVLASADTSCHPR